MVLVQSPHIYTTELHRRLPAGMEMAIKLQRVVTRMGLRRVTGFIFLTQTSARQFQNKYGPVPHSVCPWGVRTRQGEQIQPVDEAESGNTSGITVLAASTLYRYKNVETVIDAVAEVNKAGHEAVLRVIGGTVDEAYRRELFARARSKNVSVVWLGLKPNEVVRREMAAADIYLLLSPVETFGLTWLEAQTEGLVVVAPDGDLMRDVLGDGALFVDPFDYKAAAQGVLQAMADRERLSRLGTRNAAFHEQGRTVPAFFDAALALLTSADGKDV